MQMIEHPWGITVYSTASVKAAPDLVRLRFHVARLQQTPAQAFAAATEAVGAVRQAIRAHNVPDADVQRSRLSLKSQWSYGNDRKFLGYQCQASFSVESRDLDDVQQLLVDVVAAGTNEIEGVDFDVVDKPGLRAEARREAVAAARRRRNCTPRRRECGLARSCILRTRTPSKCEVSIAAIPPPGWRRRRRTWHPVTWWSRPL
jgi:uncharacterized protein YggE